MNYINLAEYIGSGLLLKNFLTDKNFDLIIYESLENEIYVNYQDQLNLKLLDKQPFDFQLGGIISSYLGKYKNILIVINKLSILYLLPLLKIANNLNITIINLNVGISGIPYKFIPDMEDVGIINNFNINIYEPYDMVNFFHLLSKKENKYIRIANKELASNFLISNKNLAKNSSGLININITNNNTTTTNNNIGNKIGTIICSGYLAKDVLIAVNQLQEQKINYDLFLFFDYKFNWEKNFLDSIQETQNLICIIDQSFDSVFISGLISKFYLQNIYNINFKFILPEYQNIKSLNNEYLREESNFDITAFHKILLG